MNRIIETENGFDIEVDGERHGSWRSRAEASAGLWVEERRAARRKMGLPDTDAEAAKQGKLRDAAPDLLEAMDPATLEAIANEIDCFEHSARAGSLRVIARQQRAAIAKAGGAA